MRRATNGTTYATMTRISSTAGPLHAAVFRTATDSHRRLTDTTLASAVLHDALDLIARDVAGRLAPADPGAAPLEAVSSGRATQVLRLRVAPPLAVVDYFLYDDGPVRLLVRRCEPIRDGIGGADIEPVDWEVVARDVASFEVRLFDGAAWTDAAGAVGPAPRLAEVTLALHTDDGGDIAASRIIPLPVGDPPAGVAP